MKKEEYFGDYDEIGEFVDALIEKKYQGRPVEGIDALRDEMINRLSDHIDSRVFEAIGEENEAKLGEFLGDENSPEKSPADYLEFFKSIGVDYVKVVENAMTEYGKEYLGGNNG